MGMEGRAALVTGASRGIGRAIALELASRGAAVAVNYVGNEEPNAREAEEVVQECVKLGVNAFAVEASVADHAACQRMVEKVASELGGVHILVNNAGIVRDRTLKNLTEEDWDAVLAVNLKGAFNVTKPLLPIMAEQKYGRIVCMSSVIGVTGGFGQTNYAASKAGLIGFVKSIAREGAAKGITANAIAPGFIDTSMLSGIPENVMAGILGQIPMGRLGKAEEIARLAGFLCSDDAAYITGQVININGGMFI